MYNFFSFCLPDIGNFLIDCFSDRSLCTWWALCSAGAGQPLTSVMKSKVTHACQSFPKTHGNEICETGNHLLKFSIRLNRCIISLSAVERSNICHLFKAWKWKLTWMAGFFFHENLEIEKMSKILKWCLSHIYSNSNFYLLLGMLGTISKCQHKLGQTLHN